MKTFKEYVELKESLSNRDIEQLQGMGLRGMSHDLSQKRSKHIHPEELDRLKGNRTISKNPVEIAAELDDENYYLKHGKKPLSNKELDKEYGRMMPPDPDNYDKESEDYWDKQPDYYYRRPSLVNPIQIRKKHVNSRASF